MKSQEADRDGWEAQRAGRADLRDLHWHYRDIIRTLEGDPMSDTENVKTMDDGDEVVGLTGPDETAEQSTVAEYDHEQIKEGQG